MEVTRKNFKDTLPLVASSIEKADFLVIDAEFTGLINGRDVSMFDSPEEYYTTLLNGASDFLLIQFGLCAFYWSDEKKHYMNDAYNFYLFPRGRPGPERMFLCQSSSLDFLIAQGFDFNKVVRDGISYMTEPTETRLRANLAERQKSYSNEKDIIPIPEEHKQQIEDICKSVRQFLDEKRSDEMEIERCNAFIRRLLFQEFGARFKKEAYVETKVLENKNRVLKVTRITSANEGECLSTQKKDKEWEEFEDAVGFSKVARMISQSEKLVIGHNMLLDLFHTLNHFFHPLPSDYNGFKEFAHCMFPRLLDTKYMSSLPPFKDKVNSSVLQHLLATLSEPPFCLPKAESEEGRGYSKADDKHHEAGYDAYVTGLCFLSMHAHLSRMRGEPLGRVTPADCAMLKPFLNKIYLAKTAHQDSPYMNLVGDEPTPSRDHVFHLTFPKEWQRNDINQLFSPFGPVTVQFVDDTCALVALSRRELARGAARALRGDARATIVPYARYRALASQKDFDEARRNLIVRAQTPEANSRIRQVSASKVTRQKPQLPERVERPRSNSVSAPAPPAPHVRKRTSSGVFMVDEAEPPPKKSELVLESQKPEVCEVTKNNRYQLLTLEHTDTVPNGRRKLADKEKKEKRKEERPKEIERFDTEAKTKCVSAFKESESWD